MWLACIYGCDVRWPFKHQCRNRKRVKVKRSLLFSFCAKPKYSMPERYLVFVLLISDIRCGIHAPQDLHHFSFVFSLFL